MKITKLTTFLVPPRWVFLRIDTDAGISGWGEPVLEGHPLTSIAKVHEYEEYLIGKNPLNIEDIWQRIYRTGCYRGGPILMSALSGIDMALWDIKGKFHSAPVYALLGGPVRNKIRTYIWIGGDRATQLVEDARGLKEAGYNAAKMNICGELQIVDTNKKIDQVIEKFSSLREEFGNELDFALDFHGRVHAPMAKSLLKELEFFRPLFVEDAVVSEQLDFMADLARYTSIRLTIGERLHSRYDFRRVFEKRAASVINPDTAHVGGISETVRIGHMAEAYDIALSPHCPLGPIALAACLQVDAICYNAFIQEQSLGMHYNADGDLNDYLLEGKKFKFENGFLEIPDGPGLGIEIDEEILNERVAQGVEWRPPKWRHEDGSVAEW